MNSNNTKSKNESILNKPNKDNVWHEAYLTLAVYLLITKYQKQEFFHINLWTIHIISVCIYLLHVEQADQSNDTYLLKLTKFIMNFYPICDLTNVILNIGINTSNLSQIIRIKLSRDCGGLYKMSHCYEILLLLFGGGVWFLLIN